MATTATFNSTAKFQIKPEFATSIQGNVSSSHHIFNKLKISLRLISQLFLLDETDCGT